MPHLTTTGHVAIRHLLLQTRDQRMVDPSYLVNNKLSDNKEQRCTRRTLSAGTHRVSDPAVRRAVLPPQSGQRAGESFNHSMLWEAWQTCGATPLST